jgi:Ca2+-binding RTX toxin-like protein
MATQNVIESIFRNMLGVGSAPQTVGTTRTDIEAFPLSPLGNHYYQGLDGNDTISGGLGNDYIEGGAGSDTMLGGLGGNDTLGYFNSDAGVTVTLDGLGGLSLAQGGHAQGDISLLGGFENLVGSQFGDTLTGNNVRNFILGMAGNDTISGMGGNDDLQGQGGNDVIHGGNGNDRIDGDDGDDTLYGDAGDDIVNGGSGTDTLIGGSGADLLTSFLGQAVVSYESSPSGVTINLQNGTANGGDATGDTFTFINKITGSAFADSITGNNSANVLAGGSGNDILHGGNGDDTLRGDGGDDELWGDNVADGDTLEGGNGNDRLHGSYRDRLSGGDGADTFIFDNRSALASSHFDRPTITHWNMIDKIDVSGVDASTTDLGVQHFHFGGALAGRIQIAGDSTGYNIEFIEDNSGTRIGYLRVETLVETLSEANFIL